MMYVTPGYNNKEYNYINGNVYVEPNISLMRRNEINLLPFTPYCSFEISCHDPVINKWTKRNYNLQKFDQAVDVHRGMLSNEIVVESDFDSYEKNVDKMRVYGKFLESLGWKAHYFYSGNKSVHLHLFLDFNRVFVECDQELLKQCTSYYKTEKGFIKGFMEFLREMLITNDLLGVKGFDKSLVKSTHLIRCNLSKNKLGFKTFLGYSFVDLSFVPFIVNWDNGFFPKMCERYECSVPSNFDVILSRYLSSKVKGKKKSKENRKSYSLFSFDEGCLKPCVNKICTTEFVDGRKRLLFVLVNELKKVKSKEEVKILVSGWCVLNGIVFSDCLFDFLWGNKDYRLGCKFLSSLFVEIGCGFCQNCPNNRKV
jgi:hypothetical protein